MTTTGTHPREGRRARLGAGYRKLFLATTISNLGDGVGTIAYPWLASAVTRNPLLVALVAVAQRLPWLVFTLPAGVITDRVDRRRAMVAMDVLRCLLTMLVAVVVLGSRGGLPGADEIGGGLSGVVGTRMGLYLVVISATLLLGMAEVLRDNCGQTFMPAIVDSGHLERANGRIWAAEGVANTFVGPPLGSLLLLAAFALPFLVDAASFFVAAALVASIHGTFRAPPDADHVQANWRVELAAGVRWLWAHEVLRSMALILGLMNMAGMISGATFVLYAQEVLGVGPLLFSVVGFGGALGGIIGGTTASYFSKRFGSGTCLGITLVSFSAASLLIGVLSVWPAVMVLFAVTALMGTLWNVITVSLRQTIIPSHLLGRVNSVYRFFAWGMMPIGAAIGGLVIAFVGTFASRSTSLRVVWFVDAAVHLGLFVMCRSRLTTEKVEAARAAASDVAS